MKSKPSSPQGLLFSYDYQSDPNKVDTYKYEQKTPTPPSSPHINSSIESFSLVRSKKKDEVSVANFKEVEEWNLLWKELVELMTEITQFPSFLIQNSDDQRKSLLILTQKICEIAKNPKESQEYKKLINEIETKDIEIKELQNENTELKNEIENLKIIQKDELTRLTSKVHQMEKMAIQIEDLTSQVDKKKEAAQATFQKYSSKSSLYTVQNESSDNTEKHEKNNYPTKKDAHTNIRKTNSNKNNKKVKKKTSKPKNIQTESPNLILDLPNKKTTSFEIEENQRFEEDYISKLIQKYTKPDPSNPQKVQQNENPDYNFSLFNRSLKPNNNREVKNHTSKERKRRAWH